MGKKRVVTVNLNGKEHQALVEPRLLLSDFLRDELHHTGTHVGCEHGVCGACTVLLDGFPVRSCLMFAVQVDGRSIETVEGLAKDGELTPIQKSFNEHHAMQCGFCTPGFLMSCTAMFRQNPSPSEDEIKDVLGGHLCRCTGYQNIVNAVKAVAAPAGGREE